MTNIVSVINWHNMSVTFLHIVI